jgi:hypothetical protein
MRSFKAFPFLHVLRLYCTYSYRHYRQSITLSDAIREGRIGCKTCKTKIRCKTCRKGGGNLLYSMGGNVYRLDSEMAEQSVRTSSKGQDVGRLGQDV